ncbi:MAG: hypothetical protein ACE14P_04545 [Methanotrichaceae archaeon]
MPRCRAEEDTRFSLSMAGQPSESSENVIVCGRPSDVLTALNIRTTYEIYAEIIDHCHRRIILPK